MEKGDVFLVGEKEPMYIAEAVAPSGTVYARKFDLYRGGSGEAVSFQAQSQFRVLFNSLKPEDDEGWEYCEISHVVEWTKPWTGTEWFEAKITSSENKVSIARTNAQQCLRGETWLDMDDDENKKIHRNLVEQLLDEGWEEVIERRQRWFSLRLKRKET
jgi:hypothetical protein